MYLVLSEWTADWSAGRFYAANDAWSFHTVYLPYSTQVRASGRTMSVQYENRRYFTGQTSVPMVVDEYLRAWGLGMDAPTSAPTVAPAGAAATCYVRYYDAYTGERSPLSAGFDVGAGPYTWTLPTQAYDIHPGTVTFAAGVVTGIGTQFGKLRPGDRVAATTAPTRYAMVKIVTSDTSMTVDDAGIAAGPGDTLRIKPATRITHVELWRSVSGGLARYVMRVPYGLATVVENIAALSLGEAETTSFTRMPYGTMCAVYHDRLWIAGDSEDPAVVYASAQFYPERWEGLSYRTRSGRPIVAILTVRDHLLVMTDQDAEIIQGYTENDINVEVKDPEIGALSQHLTDVVHGNAWIVSSKGWFMYNGEFHQMCSARLTEWKTLVASLEATKSHMFHNSFDHTVQVALVRTYTPGPWGSSDEEIVWVADYSGVSQLIGGGYTQPAWFDDIYTTGGNGNRTTTALLYPDDRTYPMPRLFMFTSTGRILREKIDWSDYYVTADTTPISGTMVIETPLYLLGDVGGDIQEGKAFTRFWLYAKSEYQDVSLSIYCGDEFAIWRNLFYRWGYQTITYGEQPISPPHPGTGTWYATPIAAWSDTIPAAAYYVDTTPPDRRHLYGAKTVHECVLEKVSGRGICFRMSVANPQAVVFLGFGGQFKPGVAGRGEEGYYYDAP